VLAAVLVLCLQALPAAAAKRVARVVGIGRSVLRPLSDLLCIALCAALCVLLPPAAQADRYGDCNQSQDLELTVRGCTAIIDRGKRESSRNLLEAYKKRALAYLGRRDQAHLAIPDLDKVIAADPADWWALSTRGEAYSVKGDRDRALADLDRSIAINPQFYPSFWRRGIVFAKDGDDDRAIADFDKAIALKPDNPFVLRARAEAHIRKGRFDRALADLDKLVAINPLFGELRRGEVAALKAQHDKEAASREAARVEAQRAAPAAAAKKRQAPATEAGGRRVAFVVGIDRYDHLPDGLQLKKAANDATAVGDTLRDLGYEVVRAENVGRVELLRQWSRFLNTVEPGGTAAFFFAGHGVELGGVNYLIPGDVPRVGDGEEEVLKGAAIKLDMVLDGFRARKPAVSLIVLDACRDNPFVTSRGRSLGGARGLADVRAPSGTFIMYSAGAGQRAIDRLSETDPDANSVYTRHLLPKLRTPGLGIQEIAREVRREVLETAKGVGHEQVPAYYDEVIGNFCPAGCAAPTAGTPEAKAVEEARAKAEAERQRLALLQVRREVMETAKTVGHEQVPAYYDEVTGEFCPAGCVLGDKSAEAERQRLALLQQEVERLRAEAKRKEEAERQKAEAKFKTTYTGELNSPDHNEYIVFRSEVLAREGPGSHYGSRFRLAYKDELRALGRVEGDATYVGLDGFKAIFQHWIKVVTRQGHEGFVRSTDVMDRAMFETHLEDLKGNERTEQAFARMRGSSGPLAHVAGLYGRCQSLDEADHQYAKSFLASSLLLVWAEGDLLYIKGIGSNSEPDALRYAPTRTISLTGVGRAQLYKLRTLRPITATCGVA
jgi:tetratricopeptide (TPR) repeat protein